MEASDDEIQDEEGGPMAEAEEDEEGVPMEVDH